MTSWAFATVRELQTALQTGAVTRPELLQQSLTRFAKYDGKLGAALELFDYQSILDGASLAAGSLLHSIPGLVKDNICQQGRNLTCASKILQGFQATYDATAVQRLKQAGALIVGRANMDEFAMGSSNEYSAYKKVANPWDLTRVSGGSSGGSVAAVAAGLVPWALGSETGGSVRLPAAFCGVVGLKPTYGLISRYGLVAYASSLDQIGIATRTVYDNALVLSTIAGHDAHDASSLPMQKYDYTKQLGDLKLKPGLKIGVITNALAAEGMQPEIRAALEQAIQHYTKLGATISYVNLPTMDYAAAAYFIISRAEAASNLARFDGVRYGSRASNATTLASLYAKSRAQGFGP
ncbi:MAG TPA: amidase family protein, partial [Candidatus Babeliales bacterium]|nr:amidase family protein [Candidatus Babeliales bacterium]